jgi:cell division protein ZapA
MDDFQQKINGTTVEILGKSYQFKCSESTIPALQQAAAFLEEKMREIRAANNVLSADRVAVITALNLSHQLLLLKQEKAQLTKQIEERLQNLQNELERAELQPTQMELVSE